MTGHSIDSQEEPITAAITFPTITAAIEKAETAITATPSSGTAAVRKGKSSDDDEDVEDNAIVITTSEYYEPWSDSNLNEVFDLWKLSEEDQQLLMNLKERTSDLSHHPWHDPHVLLRYMFGPHGYQQAEPLFRNMIAWRLEQRVDHIFEEYTPHPVLVRYASPLVFLKDYDYDNDPIYVERGGAMDGQGLLARFPLETLTRHAIWLRELHSNGPWVQEYEERTGRCIKDITVLYDLEGLSMRHSTPSVLAWFQSHMALTDAYYPGPIKRIIIIRAPVIFRIIWNVVKHFFPACSRDKMIFCGQSNYIKTLSQYMDVDGVLPPCLHAGGRGQVATGMPVGGLEAGRIPDSIGYLGEGYVPPVAAAAAGGADQDESSQAKVLTTSQSAPPPAITLQVAMNKIIIPMPRKASKASSTKTATTVPESSLDSESEHSSQPDEYDTMDVSNDTMTNQTSALSAASTTACTSSCIDLPLQQQQSRQFVPPQGEWEEIHTCYTKDDDDVATSSRSKRRHNKKKGGKNILKKNNKNEHVHIWWEGPTGVEIAHKGYLLQERNLAFI